MSGEISEKYAPLYHEDTSPKAISINTVRGGTCHDPPRERTQELDAYSPPDYTLSSKLDTVITNTLNMCAWQYTEQAKGIYG